MKKYVPSAPVALPPRTGAPTPEFPPEARRLVVVGANGAGKTRFAARMAADLGESAFCLSALHALYGGAGAPDGIDRLYESRSAAADMLRSDISGGFERTIALLLGEEMTALLRRKFDGGGADDAPAARPTRLDRTIAVWQELFPDNRILVEGAKLLAERRDSPGAYAASRLSDGERAVLYYIGALLLAPRAAVVMVDSPEIFMHPASMAALWNRLEQLRPDCRVVYTTHDLDFAASRGDAHVVWVRGYDPAAVSWSYDVLPPDSGFGPEIYAALIGARKPVLFVEGDGMHSIDSKLYPLVFPDYTVRSLGSCNRVIEAVRSFNDLADFHHMAAAGIVDRDRRDAREVEYLRARGVMVPEVAEVENLFMLPEVVRALAAWQGKADPDKALAAVRRDMLRLWGAHIDAQALEHTRHRVKSIVEHRVDCRCDSIDNFERHIDRLRSIASPREVYNRLRSEFRDMQRDGDYEAILRVFNHKSMLQQCRVAEHCGLRRSDRNAVPDAVLAMLRGISAPAQAARAAIRAAFPDPSGAGREA